MNLYNISSKYFPVNIGKSCHHSCRVHGYRTPLTITSPITDVTTDRGARYAPHNKLHVLSGQLKQIWRNMHKSLKYRLFYFPLIFSHTCLSPLPRRTNTKTVGQRTIRLAVLTVDRLDFFQPKMLETHFLLAPIRYFYISLNISDVGSLESDIQ